MNRIRAALLLVVSLIFVAIGAAMLWKGDASDRPVAAACLALFGACALVFVGQLFPRRAPAPDANGATLIQIDRRQMAVLVIAAALIAAACPAIGALAVADGQVVNAWIVWSGTAFFGACALIGLWRLIRARPVLRLDAGGIANLAGKGWTIPWRAIRSIEAFGVKGQNFLAFDVDPAAGIAGGAMQSVNRAFGFPPFSIGVQGTGLLFDDLARIVVDHWERHRGW